MEIKSTLEILHNKGIILEPTLGKRFNINLTRDCYIGTLRDINNAMKEYTAQFINEFKDNNDLTEDIINRLENINKIIYKTWD